MKNNAYVILTDSACDLTDDQLREWGVPAAKLTFRFEDSDAEMPDGSMDSVSFYAKMRAGGVAKTSAASMSAYTDAFRAVLSTGKDILCIAFSSGLSTSCNNARVAAKDLEEEFPDRRITVVDSLCASAGQAMLVWYALRRQEDGASLDECAAYLDELKMHQCHWFTVDDLAYLRRGGRISAATAVVGSMLQIKPVMHMDNEGHLIAVGKVRGRKASLQALADKYTNTVLDKTAPVFISHGDCPADVEALSDMIEKAGGPRPMPVYVGPVIGSHSGPGTLALFFIGKER